MDVQTKVGKQFLKLLDKHFPTEHIFHKIFNRNNVKISYCCTRNIKTLIANNNMRKLNENNLADGNANCNCEEGVICPLNGNCMQSTVVYKAKLITEPENLIKEYIGSTKGTFKSKWYNHIKAFRNKKYANDTALSKKVWELRQRGKTCNISWNIVKKANKYRPGLGNCDLCTSEKVLISKADIKNSLNLRSEIMAKCRHQAKFLLGSQTEVT